ncbi:PBS lyase HEAT-like repeat protein [Calothrix parasitica NIES-267]|uniref:PBS lyase HEAT-like repeat protein n=1 Tax=Calothrix parasitica NIES-267 TaxID=1973488 RepID=A0A1Z4M1J8_9CYAN|nr:PBS lyase HEAT-like repeat protein [Calothrix parasitica NIES-267]
MTTIKNNLKRIWDCIEQKAPEVKDLFQPGLKSEEIDEITKDLPFNLPQEVYELYQWRNGLLNSAGFDIYGHGNSASHFDSLETAIQDIIKIKSGETFLYFLIIFWVDLENGRHYFAVSLGIDIFPVDVTQFRLFYERQYRYE